MSLISVEGYKNAGVCWLKIKETDELWVNMGDVGDGLGAKNMSDLVSKELKGIYEKKNWQKMKLRIIKWQKEKYLRNLVN